MDRRFISIRVFSVETHTVGLNKTFLVEKLRDNYGVSRRWGHGLVCVGLCESFIGFPASKLVYKYYSVVITMYF